MSTHKAIDRICCVVIILSVILSALWMCAPLLGIQQAATVMGYEQKLFDTSLVHTVNIVMDDWQEFIDNCRNEEYYNCSVVIDNEAFKNVAIRGKGNTSLSRVESYGNDRYSFKLEFDHYDNTKTYHGLDKLCLNNIIQDNTYMKDYLTYRMMAEGGAAAPLCSFVYITVNGEDWGLYLAVESIEDSFLQRNYGSQGGQLYKPDSMNMGGGRGNGKNFDMDEFNAANQKDAAEQTTLPDDNAALTSPDIKDPTTGDFGGGRPTPPEGGFPGQMTPPDAQGGPGQMTPPDAQGGLEQMTPPDTQGGTGQMTPPNTQNGQNTQRPNIGNGGPGGGSDDVLLKYIDDNPESYANIFDNAKTEITDADKQRLIASLKALSEGADLENTLLTEQVIRYFAVHNFVLNFDSYTGSMIHNYYLYEQDGQLSMLPWDYNLAFGGFQSAGGATSLINYPIDSPVSGGNTADRPMIAWIFANEQYTEQYHQVLSEWIADYFESGRFSEEIDRTIQLIAPYVAKDPTKFCTYEEFTVGAATLRSFCLLRAESVRAQLNGTIGRTSDTQQAETLIDAGDLQISDMGDMGGMGGMGGKNDRTQTDQPTAPETPDSGEQTTDQPAAPETPDSGEQTTDQPAVPETPDSGEQATDQPAAPETPDSGEQTTDQPAVPETPDSDEQTTDQPAAPETPDSGEQTADQPAALGQEQGRFPDGNRPTAPTAEKGTEQSPTVTITDWLWLGSALLILTFGLLIALGFKRRK